MLYCPREVLTLLFVGLAIAQFLMTSISFLCLLYFVIRDMIELLLVDQNQPNQGDAGKHCMMHGFKDLCLALL